MVLYYRCCIFNFVDFILYILDTKTFKQKSYSNDSWSEFQTYTFFDIKKNNGEKKIWLSLYKFAFATVLVPSGNDHHFQMHRSCLMSIVSLSKSCQNLLFQNKIKSFLWYLFLFKRSISVWFRNTTTKSVVKKDVTPPSNFEL